MTVAQATYALTRRVPESWVEEEKPPALRGEGWRIAAWIGLALVARWPLLARVEGVLDDDQSVVGLMAMDIAGGRRLPIYFDGQRYMGAIEAYTAAAFE